MKAFVIDRYKRPLHQADIPEPVLGAQDVLVEVGAANVNQIDVRIMRGEFKRILPYKPPFVLGHDLAGTVSAIGRGVRRFAVGDAVYARPRDGRIGTFAERIAVAEDDLAMAPKSASVIEAASLPLVALTAWQALMEIADVKPGQQVLIHAGTGGVGSIAIQLAKHLGATVATTASPSDADFLRSLGADVVIDYDTEDRSKPISDFDLVLDTVGVVDQSLEVVRPGGKVIGIAGPPTLEFAKQAGLGRPIRFVIAAVSAATLARANKLGVDYEFLLMRASGAQLEQIAALVDAGTIRPQVGSVFDFAETPEALTIMAADALFGKVVVSRS